jgi:hypothetical protein
VSGRSQLPGLRNDAGLKFLLQGRDLRFRKVLISHLERSFPLQASKLEDGTVSVVPRLRDAQPTPLDKQQSQDVSELLTSRVAIFRKLLEMPQERIGVQSMPPRLIPSRNSQSPIAERSLGRSGPSTGRKIEPDPFIPFFHNRRVAHVAGTKWYAGLRAALEWRTPADLHRAPTISAVARGADRT